MKIRKTYKRRSRYAEGQRGGEAERRGDGETGRRADGQTGRRGKEEKERWIDGNTNI